MREGDLQGDIIFFKSRTVLYLIIFRENELTDSAAKLFFGVAKGWLQHILQQIVELLCLLDTVELGMMKNLLDGLVLEELGNTL